MYAKANGNPSTGAMLGAMEAIVKAVRYRRAPPSWPLFPHAHNPPELDESALGGLDMSTLG
jgi:hypothetical protein